MKFTSYLHSSAALLVALAAGGAAAQPVETLVLPQMVVSASRTAVEAKEVGSAISVITAEEIERSQSRFVADVLRQVPGVTVSRAGALGELTQVRMRGAEANHTLVIIDGVEVNDPINSSEFDFSSLLADDIERIEVLRGPQSAIWGSDSIGGVVNIVTKRGRQGLRGQVSAEGGSFGTRRFAGSIGGGTERMRGSLSGSFLETNGINAAADGNEREGYRNGTLNATGDIDLTDNFSVNFNGRYTKVDAQLDRQDYLFPPSPTQGLVIDSDNEYESEQLYGRAQARLRLFDGAWEQVIGTAYTRSDRENFEDGARTTASLGTKTKFDYQSTFSFATPSFAGADHVLTFYAEREEEYFRNRTEGFPAANQNQETADHGFVGEYRLGLWDRLFLAGAIRFDDNDGFRDATTWRATAAYVLPEAGTRFHGSYATGVTNPNFFELFGFNPGTFQGNPNLKPEKSESWDVGIEQQFLEGRFTLDVTWFQADLQDEITTIYPAPTFIGTPVNLSGESKRWGIEIAGKARVTDDFDLTGSFTYLRAEEPDGEIEVRRPKFLASLNANYRFLDGRGNINLSADYNGRMQDNEFVDATPRTRVWLDDFVLVNFAGSYRLSDSVELFGRVENLLDEDYQEVFSYQSPGIGAYAGVRIALGGY